MATRVLGEGRDGNKEGRGKSNKGGGHQRERWLLRLKLTQQRVWRAMKRAMTRAAWVMATATKRVMATNGNNMGNSYGKEGGGRSLAATMAMGMGTAQRIQPLTQQLERVGSW
jgi:hypothetical protein